MRRPLRLEDSCSATASDNVRGSMRAMSCTKGKEAGLRGKKEGTRGRLIRP